MATVAWTPAAQNDLREIYDYIGVQNHSPAAADRLIRRIHSQAEVHARNPGLGQNRPDLAPNLRLFRVGNYIIFYVTQDDGIAVVRVIQGARDYGSFFQDS